MNSENWRRPRLVEDLGPSHGWQRSYRRVRARGWLADPLGQGVVAVSSAMLTAASGVWLLLLGYGQFGGWALGLALVEANVFLALAARAFKRDKAVKFWRERRQLRIDLERMEAYQGVLLQAHRHSRNFQSHAPGVASTKEALGELIELTFKVFAPTQDDLAILVVEETDRRCHILQSVVSQGSRWRVLDSGKRCVLKGTLDERLDELAQGHQVQMKPIGTNAGCIWLIMLHDSPLSKAEFNLLQPLFPIFESILDSGPIGALYENQSHLRLIRTSASSS